MSNKRIFILASERSGTNLLRVLLGNHKDISAPVAVHFFNTFKSSLSYYGDLKEKKNSVKLLNHFLKSANHPYTDWKLEVDFSKFSLEKEVYSFETAMDFIHKCYVENENKKHYVCKDNDLYDYISLLENLEKKDSSTYYIYLTRDPRDHAVSWLKTPLFLHTVFDIAKKWNREQNTVLSYINKINMYHLKYEDLIKDTRSAMTNVLNFIDLKVDENCFNTDSNNKESKRNELWKNLSKPIIRNNSNKFLERLSKKEIKILETICKENMNYLGYDLVSKANWVDYFGLYQNYILPKERKRNKLKNNSFYEQKMKDLSSKLDLLNNLKNEVKSD